MQCRTGFAVTEQLVRGAIASMESDCRKATCASIVALRMLAPVLDVLQEMIIFMAVEAAGVVPLCCVCLFVLLTLVNRSRLKLFNVFLVSSSLLSILASGHGESWPGEAAIPGCAHQFCV